MKDWADFGATQWFWTWDPWIGIPAALTTRLLLQEVLIHFPSKKEIATVSLLLQDVNETNK